MPRRAAALGLFLAVLAGALVPCGEPPPEASAAGGNVVAAASEVADDAWCRGREPAQLLPACPCGCEQRPHVAGVPVGVGLAVRAALPELILPPVPPAPPALTALRARPGIVRMPDPVPLVALS